MSPERQRQVLAGLVAVLAAVAAWQWVGASIGGAPVAQAPGAARRASGPAVPAPPADVALDALERARLAPADGGRNPFVFGAGRPAADDGASVRPGRRGGVPPPDLPPAPPPGPPPLPPIPLKFIGLVEGTSTATRIAVLSDSKGLVVHGTEGAIIDGRFKILAIGPESIEIAYADGRGRQTLRLSGQ